jgi:hypothetical protein
LVDEGLIARTGQSAVALGADAKLANGAGDYVAFQRRNAATYLYRVGTDGAVRNGVMTLVDSSGAVSVDIDRASDTQWLAASTLNGTGVQTRLVGLNGSGDPAVTFSRLVADTNADGVARVAINSVADGRVLYQAGPAVRTAAIVSLGATTATTGTTLPGTQHRPELGMDIVSRPGTAFGYVIAWVAGASPQVHIAYIISGTVSGDVVVGAGSNPSLDINDVGIVGVTYTGIDNRPRFHSLLPGLNCVNGGGAPNTCAQTLGTLTVNAPPGGFISQRTLDIAADGRAFWVTARVSDGEQVYRVSNAAVHDDLHRAVSTTVTTWMSVGAQAGRPLVLRGNAAGYTHDTYGCL